MMIMVVTMTNVDLAQALGFQRVRIGDLLITALYDGFGAIPVEDFHGGAPAQIGQFLGEAFLPRRRGPGHRGDRLPRPGRWPAQPAPRRAGAPAGHRAPPTPTPH